MVRVTLPVSGKASSIVSATGAAISLALSFALSTAAVSSSFEQPVKQKVVRKISEIGPRLDNAGDDMRDPRKTVNKRWNAYDLGAMGDIVSDKRT